MSILRLIVFAVLAYVIFRIIRIGVTISHWKSDEQPEAPPIPPFSNVEEADFEDLSKEEKPPEKS